MKILVVGSIILCSSWMLLSCRGSEQNISGVPEALVEEHTSRNSLDWNGTYTGVLKGLEGENFTVFLSLEVDGIYTIELKQEGKNDIVKRNKINWSLDGQKIELFDVNEILNNFFVGENYLIQLDKKGELPADRERINYQLNKVQDEN